jgi:hypothetical protein
VTIVGNGKHMPDNWTPSGRDPNDPPIFLLQASPTWAPWLPDTVFQRIPIGGTGQVLTVQADGSVAWQNSAAGFANPMTTAGDMLFENAVPAPARLAIGSSGQVLTVVGGLPSWQPNPSGLNNPMTTTGDLIASSPGSTPIRVGIGTAGQVLTVSGGLPTWQNSASGFANPMTTTGDLITSSPGAMPVRLGVGANNQVLSVVGGVPAWANSPAGFANPMTQAGDLIMGGFMGTATRLAAGASGQVLTMVSGAPAWAAGQNAASAVVFPSTDTSGVTDRANITAAYPAHGGEVLLASGEFYVKPPSGLICLTVPAQTTTYQGSPSIAGLPVSMRGLGAATVLYPVGAGVTGIYYHRTTSYGAQFGNPADPGVGFLRNFVIDGTFATAAAIGLDFGDGRGYDLDLSVQNFDTTGAIGVMQANRLGGSFWTEKNTVYRLQLYNNSTAMYITVVAGSPSCEYNHYDINMFCAANQQGVVVDGPNMGGSHMWLRGNMSQTIQNTPGAPLNNVAALSIINAAGVAGATSHRWYEGSIYIKVESNPGNGGGSNPTSPYLLYSDGVGYIRNVIGELWLSSLTPSNWNGAELTFSGATDDPNLQAIVNGYVTTGAGTGGTIIAENITGTGTVLQVVNQGSGATSVPIQFVGQAPGDHLFGCFIAGESNARFKIDAANDVQWGAGGASVTDVDIKRTAVGTLTMGDGTSGNNNVILRINGSSALNQNALFIGNGVAPGTPTGGGILYVSAGALLYKGSSGTITPIAPA